MFWDIDFLKNSVDTSGFWTPYCITYILERLSFKLVDVTRDLWHHVIN